MMGVGIRGVGVARARGFNPATLFQGGTAGAWYDPSDLSTMFDSSAGTTPVAMPGQGAAVPVGLMLDKSQGLVLGANDITGFTPTIVGTATAATYNSTTGAGTAARVNGSNISYLNKTGLTSNRVYRITVTNTGSSNFEVRQNGYAISLFIVTPGATVTGLVTTYTHTDVSIVPNTNGTTIAFTIVSFQQVSGNHAISFNNTTARPELMARVNLLTYSEEFDNGAWTKVSVTVTANAAVAPDGTTTADKIINNNASTGNITVIPTLITNTAYTLTGHFRKDEWGWAALEIRGEAADSKFAWFNLNSGTIGTVSSQTTATITAVGNDWYRCTMTRTTGATTSSPRARFYLTNADNTFSTGDGTSGIYIWGADLRPANIGANVPAYQRIADANTYDTSGFPLYLRFDGIDDSMYTPANLNLSGTDKVAVFAGVRKLSDAARGMVAELSATTASNNGSFRLAAPEDATFDYSMTSRGTVDISAAINSSIYAAPNTSVLTGTADISAPSIALRINGAQVVANSTSQGTGNYGTYPLYIGARNNSSQWLNGHLYSLAVVGSVVSAGNIAAMESWVAGKTGIQI